MQTHTCFFYENEWNNLTNSAMPAADYQLMLVFGDRFLLEDASHITALKQVYTNATIVSCSTSGEIYDRQVYDNSIVATAVCLEKTALQKDGKVSYIQPIGEKAIPGQVVDVNSTANFGVGAFLLASCELYRYLKK